MLIAPLCGVLFALCLPRPGLCPLAWGALAPFLGELAKARSWKAGARAGLFFGFAFWGTALYWVYSTCRFAGVPWPAAVLAWGSMAGVFSFSWALFGAAAQWLRRRMDIALWPWACAASWAAIEFIGDRFLPYLGALPLGYSQWRYLSWIQGSSFAGPHALGFLIMLINAVWAAALVPSRPDSPRALKQLTSTLKIAVGITLIWWGLGFFILSEASSKKWQGERSVAILQPNVDQYRKWDFGFLSEIRGNIADLIQSVSKDRPDLVIWPETADPGWLEDPENFAWVSKLVRGSGASQILGVLSHSPEGAAPGRAAGAYNAAVLIGPDGKLLGAYHKRQLVPFGEYVPWRSLTSRFIGILNQMGDLDAGPKNQPLLSFQDVKLGATICYEAVFPDLTRTNSEGADWIVNLTNDGWYKDTWGPYQHFYANIFRAVENRRFVLRAANTGISGIIDPYGRVLARLELGRREALTALVPVGMFPSGSFYSRHGDWFGWLALFGAFSFVIYAAVLGPIDE